MNNGLGQFQYVKVGPPARPANNGTVTLLDSTRDLPGGLSANNVGRVTMSFPGIDQASATSGLIGYSSVDKGVTWYKKAFTVVGTATALPATVAADSGADSSSFDVYVGTEEDVKFTLTVGATTPTAAKWLPILKYVIGNVHSGT